MLVASPDNLDIPIPTIPYYGRLTGMVGCHIFPNHPADTQELVVGRDSQVYQVTRDIQVYRAGRDFQASLGTQGSQVYQVTRVGRDCQVIQAFQDLV